MRSKLFVSLCFVLCWGLTAYAQIELRTGVRTRIDGVEGWKQFGDVTLIEAGTRFTDLGNVGIIEILTKAPDVEIDVSNEQRVPFEPRKLETTDGSIVYMIDTPGKWWIEVVASDVKNKTYFGRKKGYLEFGVSPGPHPPGPGPAPTPTPTPTPGPVPIEGMGLRVIFVTESSEAIKLTKDQEQILFGPIVRDFLNANAAKNPADGSSDWRILDPDTTYSNPNDKFAKALTRPRASLPWIIVSNGVSGYEGPLPANVNETLALLQKFLPKAATNAKVTMLSSPTCGICKEFVNKEKPLLGNIVIEAYAPAKAYPTFVIEANGKREIREGYHTAKDIQAVIKRLGER
jgi:hypothetical protein